ncbi:hypothetical protein B9T25_06120 [Acinetobacter sp. ANC 4470]|uniref:retron St85 family effector protein n=1 Tax=Acinetobacter sp. ANC 4470 TaxID=1977881 RepID=UPI000A35A5DA|nr:retron St85 family effector protein [Acinetobacter sp. ANC 4470]OTG68256.1 hypothetical protein B9T25_06120 [Acinetobacter sp. ANC 4470]
MTYEDLLLEEVSKWDINKSTLTYTHPLIFICGGSLDKKIDKVDDRYFFESLRKYLIEYAPINNSNFNLRTAEDLKDYLTVYDDLLEFESDIAKISDLILIILESPGTLTELGIFLSNDEYQKKLVVIRNKAHTFEDSFINLGPLLALKNLKDTSVLDYDWPYCKKFKELDNQTLNFICGDINDHLKSPTTNTKINPNDFSHIILCIYEIVRLFFPISEYEILNIIQLLFNDKNITRSRIKKICYLLYKLDFLDKESVSSKTFYYPSDHKITKVKFNYIAKERFEFLKIRLAIKEFLDTLVDTKRLHVLNVIQGQ